MTPVTEVDYVLHTTYNEDSGDGHLDPFGLCENYGDDDPSEESDKPHTVFMFMNKQFNPT